MSVLLSQFILPSPSLPVYTSLCLYALEIGSSVMGFYSLLEPQLCTFRASQVTLHFSGKILICQWRLGIMYWPPKMCSNASLCIVLSCGQLFASSWNVACQAPLSGCHFLLEWVAISFSRGSPQPKDWTHISCIGRWILYHWATWQAQ